MTDPAALLAGCLPADPTDHGPVAVPSDAVRGVLAEHKRLRTELHAEHLARDPGFVAECDAIERQLRDGTLEPGRPVGEVVDELRKRYSDGGPS